MSLFPCYPICYYFFPIFLPLCTKFQIGKSFLPYVDKLEVGGLGDGLVDALIHGVHDEHHGQRESNGHVQVQVAEEKSDFSDHQ
jgi:hypothetical protein